MDAPIDEIEEASSSIAEMEAAENREKILKNFKYYSENPENIQMQKMWKIVKKFMSQSKINFTLC